MYNLYWIHLKEHTDPFTEGYIGLTSQTVEQRLDDHKHNHKNRHLRNRCRMDNVVVECLYSNLTQHEVRKLEERYRPIENIGWNINKGGDLPPSRKGKISPGSLLKGEARTEAQKAGSRMASLKRKGKKLGPQNRVKVDHSKPCVLCGNIFNPGYNTRSIYCSKACAARHRNQDQNYLKLLSEKTKSRWNKPGYRLEVGNKIKQALKEKKEGKDLLVEHNEYL